MGYFREYRTSDFSDVMNMTLREEDINELKASSNDDIKSILAESLIISGERYVILNDSEEVIGIFGVTQNEIKEEVGIPWLLGTDDLLNYQMKFLRNNRKVIKKWLTKWTYLTNAVHSENTVAIKWLKWLGFTVVDYMPITMKDNHKFYPFFIERK